MHETITVLNMPGIRTRAGLIRVLEYDKNVGLISTNDSLGRINILFMIGPLENRKTCYPLLLLK